LNCDWYGRRNRFEIWYSDGSDPFSARTPTSPAHSERQVISQGWQVVRQWYCRTNLVALGDLLAGWADAMIWIILTTGGTGFSRRYHFGATQAVIERAAPGLAEAMRLASFKSRRMLCSRATVISVNAA
jgi:molybdopterin biosynthesis enzyme MoaB